MVERERDEGEAARAVSGGPLQQEGVVDKAEGERDEKGGGDEQGGELVDEEKEEEEKGEEEWSEIRLAIAELSPAKLKSGGVKPAAASPPHTPPFLGLSHLLLRVLDKIGPTMAGLRLDVQRNIERLQELYLLDPCKYSTLTGIVEKEVKDGTARDVDSCSRAVLWLTRDWGRTLISRALHSMWKLHTTSLSSHGMAGSPQRHTRLQQSSSLRRRFSQACS